MLGDLLRGRLLHDHRHQQDGADHVRLPLVPGARARPDDRNNSGAIHRKKAEDRELSRFRTEHFREDLAVAADFHWEHAVRARGHEGAQSAHVHGAQAVFHTHDDDR